MDVWTGMVAICGKILSNFRKPRRMPKQARAGSADRKNLRRVYATCVRNPKNEGDFRGNCWGCEIKRVA